MQVSYQYMDSPLLSMLAFIEPSYGHFRVRFISTAGKALLAVNHERWWDMFIQLILTNIKK
jgi:hypothetical protein